MPFLPGVAEMPPVVPRRHARPVVRRSSAPPPAAPESDLVRVGTFNSALGTLLVAATERGVCYVALGDDADMLRHELRAAFPRAPVTSDVPRLTGMAHQIERMLAGAEPAADLPLDIMGTPFQERVWSELRRIPRGERCSYQQLAECIGRPTAARAVAQACARNRVAVLVPCHRVVRGDGEPGGYRWGIQRKLAILNAERAATETSGQSDT